MQPFAHRMERDAILLMLELEPSCSQSKSQPATADDIHRSCHLRQHCGMAVGIAGDHQAEADPTGRHRQRGERRPSLETSPCGIRKDGEEMIETPRRIVIQLVDLLPEGKNFSPGDVLLWSLDTETDWIRFLLV